MANAQRAESIDATPTGTPPCPAPAGRGLAEFAHGLAEHLEDARAKLYLVWRGLDLRRALEPVFTHGQYIALPAKGERAEHVVAFGRRHGDRVVVAIAPRLCYRLLDGERRLPVGERTWGDTRLPLPEEWGELSWTDHLTGAVVSATASEAGDGRTEEPVATRRETAISMHAALAHFPVALLVGGAPDGETQGP